MNCRLLKKTTFKFEILVVFVRKYEMCKLMQTCKKHRIIPWQIKDFAVNEKAVCWRVSM
jgi:hypothetical protein